MNCPICYATTHDESQAEKVVLRHDGQSHTIVAEVLVTICDACGAKFFDNDADDIFRSVLRDKLKIMHPAELRELRLSLKLTQKEVSKATGIAIETLSRIENNKAIQSITTDRLLRYYFRDQVDLIKRDTARAMSTEVGNYSLERSRVWAAQDATSDGASNASCIANTQYALAA